jgi:hypothetical protein
MKAWPRCLSAVFLRRRNGCSASPAADVEKYLAGLASWSADFSKPSMTAAARYCAAPPASSICSGRENFAGIIRSLPSSWFWPTVSRSGSTTRTSRRPTCATWTAPSRARPRAIVGGRLGERQFDIKALPADGGLRWFQLIPKHRTRISNWCASASTRRRAGVHVPGGQAQSDHAADLHPSLAQCQISPPTCFRSRRRRESM